MSDPPTINQPFLPSKLAAILAGAVVMPLFVFGLHFIEMTLHSQLFAILWSIAAFLLPVLFAIADLRYLARRRREQGGFFRAGATPVDDFRLFYIPAWKRLVVWFVSSAISLSLLRSLGVAF
jgi:hypothetical protein